MKAIIKIFYVFAAVLLTAYICSVLIHIGLERWYNDFAKPWPTPPNNVFPVVWSIIYVLLAVSTAVVLLKADSVAANKTNNLFMAQLGLQILWCFFFFKEGQLAAGLAVIILLDVVVYKMAVVFSRIKKAAGYLLYPYYWWLVFATFLNMTYVASFGVIVTF